MTKVVSIAQLKDHVGTEVSLQGWLYRKTGKGKLHFLQMRDGTGTGLDNVRARLQNAFPNRHSLEFFEKEGSVHVQLEIRGLTEKSGEKRI